MTDFAYLRVPEKDWNWECTSCKEPVLHGTRHDCTVEPVGSRLPVDMRVIANEFGARFSYDFIAFFTGKTPAAHSAPGLVDGRARSIVGIDWARP